MNKLIKTLQKLSTKIVSAKNTKSQYFLIGCIKVRISDHLSNSTDADLNIFCNSVNKHNTYVVVPAVGQYKEIQWFTNIKDLTEFIIQFEKFSRILVKNLYIKNSLSTVVETKQKQLLDFIDILEWRKHLANWYMDKRVDFSAALDKIFNECNGNVNVLRKIQHHSQDSLDRRKQFLIDLHNRLTK